MTLPWMDHGSYARIAALHSPHRTGPVGAFVPELDVDHLVQRLAMVEGHVVDTTGRTVRCVRAPHPVGRTRDGESTCSATLVTSRTGRVVALHPGVRVAHRLRLVPVPDLHPDRNDDLGVAHLDVTVLDDRGAPLTTRRVPWSSLEPAIAADRSRGGAVLGAISPGDDIRVGGPARRELPLPFAVRQATAVEGEVLISGLSAPEQTFANAQWFGVPFTVPARSAPDLHLRELSQDVQELITRTFPLGDVHDLHLNAYQLALLPRCGLEVPAGRQLLTIGAR